MGYVNMSRYRIFYFVVLLIVLYSLTFAYVLPMLCRTWVYSFYFSVHKNDLEIVRRVVHDNDVRTQSSEVYLSNLVSNQIRQFRIEADHSKTQIDLTIGIITIKRSDVDIELRYLTQTTARLLSILIDLQNRDTEFKNINLFVCNVDIKPHEHDEAIRISEYVSYVTRFKNRSQRINFESIDKFEKEKDDYIFCMKEASKSKPRYVMLVEDDVLLDENAILIVNHLVQSRIKISERRTSIDHDAQKWVTLKLYYPQKWSGYANEIERLSELVGLALIGGSLFTFIHLLMLGMLFRPIRSKPTSLKLITSLVVFGLGAATLVIVAVLIGRPYVRSWRRLSIYTHRLVSAPDCCTQAVLYPTEIISDLTRYLQDVSCSVDFAVDLAIDQFAKLYKLGRFLVEPNVARHIGFVSTVRSKDAADFL